MILGKFSRFIKRYNLALSPRHKAAARLNIVDKQGQPSILRALHRAIQQDKAATKTAAGDTVELLKAIHDEKRDAIVLLFHRVSPHAPDPMYRRKSPKREVTVRKSNKAIDEDQSLSAHFLISTKSFALGQYKSALEEVPGISIAAVQSIISEALRNYTYDFKNSKGESQESYMMIKSSGVKSETLDGALRKGSVNFLTLIKPGDNGIVDSEGIFQPVDQRMKIKITDTPIDKPFLEKLDDFVKRARIQGWQQFDVDLHLDDDRHRTIKIERDQDAKDILFVRAEEVMVKNELPLCTTELIDEVVAHAAAVMAKI